MKFVTIMLLIFALLNFSSCYMKPRKEMVVHIYIKNIGDNQLYNASAWEGSRQCRAGVIAPHVGKKQLFFSDKIVESYDIYFESNTDFKLRGAKVNINNKSKYEGYKHVTVGFHINSSTNEIMVIFELEKTLEDDAIYIIQKEVFVGEVIDDEEIVGKVKWQ